MFCVETMSANISAENVSSQLEQIWTSITQ